MKTIYNNNDISDSNKKNNNYKVTEMTMITIFVKKSKTMMQ